MQRMFMRKHICLTDQCVFRQGARAQRGLQRWALWRHSDLRARGPALCLQKIHRTLFIFMINITLRLDCYIKHTHHQDDKDFNVLKWCYRGSGVIYLMFRASALDMVGVRNLFQTLLENSWISVLQSLLLDLLLSCDLNLCREASLCSLSGLPSVTLSLLIFILFFSAGISFSFFPHPVFFLSPPLCLAVTPPSVGVFVSQIC